MSTVCINMIWHPESSNDINMYVSPFLPSLYSVFVVCANILINVFVCPQLI